MNSKKGGKSKGARKDFQKLFKVAQPPVVDAKDILELLKEKLIDDASSAWYQADILYIVAIYRRKIAGIDGNANVAGGAAADRANGGASGNNGSANNAGGMLQSNLRNNRQGRYLVILRKTESPHPTRILRVVRKDTEIEVKQTYEVQSLRSIDYGEEENELILQFEHNDVSIHLFDANERDQTLWIFTQVFKAVTGTVLATGYSVDIDTVSYSMATSGVISKFAVLQKLVAADASQLGDRFSADEAEAEAILDQLQWSKSLSEQQDIHQILARSGEKLNNEIIDFLLQWEEMDECAALGRAPSGASAAGRLFGLKDTKEVLLALQEVDAQLETVDRWLGEQVDRLAEIQANLHMIEDESGALETSWQNLNVVQGVVGLLVNKLSLSSSQEALLAQPDAALLALARLTSLTAVERALEPLVEAATRLRDALRLRPAEASRLTVAQWKQVQAIHSIAEQRNKLSDLCTSFCTRLGTWAAGLFDWLLRHRSLTEGEGSGGGSGGSGLVPKAFPSSRACIEEVCFAQVDGFISNPSQMGARFRLPRAKYRVVERNTLLEVQARFHHQAGKFAALLDLLVELDAEQSRVVTSAYQQACAERLYGPLLKAFVKDLQAQLSTRSGGPMSLASCARYRSDLPLTLRFYCATEGTGGGLSSSSASTTSAAMSAKNAASTRTLYSWRVLEVALLLVSPLVDAEEAFIKRVFHLDGRRPEGSSQTALSDRADTVALVADAKTFATSRLHSVLVGVFEALLPRLLSLSQTSHTGAAGEADGVEAVAMLAVLDEFAACYADRSATSSTSQPRPSVGGADAAALQTAPPTQYFYTAMLFGELRQALEARVQTFTSEQVAWVLAQRGDPRQAGVFPPFYRFPTLVKHLLEMSHGHALACVDDCLHRLAKELCAWLTSVANASEKYADKVRIANFSFFLYGLSGLTGATTLQPFLQHAAQQVRECTARYVHWMVAYEFPSLSALATRIDGVSHKVSDDELSLYIRRKDVLSVVKELESRTVDSMVQALRKRLEKHFKSDFDMELRLVDSLWLQIKERVVSILSKLEAAATVSYQIALDVGPRQVAQAFDKQQLVS